MGPLGWQETVAIFVLALLIFGPKKLPQLGKDLAKMMGEFRRASSDLRDTWHREMAAVERETREIQDEANKIVAPYTDSTYNYDSSYDYGGYGYSESYDGTSESTTTASATAIEGAAAEATETPAPAEATPAGPEGTVPTSTTAEAEPEPRASSSAQAEPAASR